MADLQLEFKLGLPEDSHLPSNPNHQPPKYKTPARKAKDRARAAAHQQAQLSKTDFNNQLQAVPQQQGHQQQHGAPPPTLELKAGPASPQGSPDLSQNPPEHEAAVPAAVVQTQADSAPTKPKAVTASINAAPAFQVPTKSTALKGTAPALQDQDSQDHHQEAGNQADQIPRKFSNSRKYKKMESTIPQSRENLRELYNESQNCIAKQQLPTPD